MAIVIGKNQSKDVLGTEVARELGCTCPFIVHLINILRGRLSAFKAGHHKGASSCTATGG